jgi:hypothetical protein
MRLDRRSPLLLVALFLAACGGNHRPLGTIEPVPGSRTHEIKPLAASPQHEIVPLDSTRPHEVQRLDASGHEIVPTDPAHTIRPLAGAALRVNEVPPLHDSAGAAREIVPLDSAVVPLDGTVWQGQNYEGTLQLEFLAGGTLRYTTANGSWTNGTWHQEGHAITFEMNAHYADYTGQVRGSRMSGAAHNATGRRWDWSATRE